MEPLQKNSASNNNDSLNYGFFLDNMDYCLDKGKGFSLFNSDEHAIDSFCAQSNQKRFDPLTIRLSSMDAALQKIPNHVGFVVIIQDLNFKRWHPSSRTSSFFLFGSGASRYVFSLTLAAGRMRTIQ
jgi:hypothetical protein